MLQAIATVVHGSGEQVARAAAETLYSWSLINDIVGMSSDITTANTSHLSGAYVLLEQKSGRKLLWLACRHHIPEVLCGDIFRKVFGPTSRPNVTLFRRFHEYWPKVDQAEYKSCSDSRLHGSLAALKRDTATFCLDIRAGKRGHIPIKDYGELMGL